MTTLTDWPAPGSDEELAAWDALNAQMGRLHATLSQFPREPQDVVVVPSLSLDSRELRKISGVWHYEERMLVNLMLLRQPRTRLIYVTSQMIDPKVIDYYLSLLPGIPNAHARKRLILMHCSDASAKPLSQKLLERPRLLQRIRAEIRTPERAHLVCFNSTGLERTLAVRLSLPLHSVDPRLNDLGTKSGCREVFREAGIDFPYGHERLTTPDDIARALSDIKQRDPGARRAVVKLNDGFSGEGNALFYYGDVRADDPDCTKRILDMLPGEAMRYVGPGEDWESFSQKYLEMQGIVESFVEGDDKASPSVQCRVNGAREPQVISTHDQVLGGESGQIFEGCTFPAAEDYRMELHDSGSKVAAILAERGVLGRFAIDFMSVRNAKGGWDHKAIEINLRKGGTTHPFLTLKFLTAGTLNQEDGLFYAPSGRPKYYFATDTIQAERYRGLLPEDLVDIAVYHGLHFHGPSERGIVFHLIGALSEFGKLGIVAIGDNITQARFLYKRTLQVLDEEAGNV